MQTVSSAYVTSSKLAPGDPLLASTWSAHWRTNVTAITIEDTPGDGGHPCLMPMCCACQTKGCPSTSPSNAVFLWTDRADLISVVSTSILSIALNICSTSTCQMLAPSLLMLGVASWQCFIHIRKLFLLSVLHLLYFCLFCNHTAFFCTCLPSVCAILFCRTAAKILYSRLVLRLFSSSAFLRFYYFLLLRVLLLVISNLKTLVATPVRYLSLHLIVRLLCSSVGLPNCCWAQCSAAVYALSIVSYVLSLLIFFAMSTRIAFCF